MANVKKPDNALIIQMIYAKQGNIAEIARAFNIRSRRTIDTWIKKNKALREALEDARETQLDFTESQAFLLAKGIPKVKKNPTTGKDELIGWEEKPDTSMIKYILSTQGKKRGWGESIDVTTGGDKINTAPPFQLTIKVKDEPEGTDTE